MAILILILLLHLYFYDHDQKCHYWDSVFCLHGFAPYFTRGSGEIYAKLLLNKMKNVHAIVDTPRTSRRSVSDKTLTKVCFFCNAKNYSEALHECETLYLGMRVRKIVGHKIVQKAVWGRHGCHRSQVPSTLSSKTVR